MSGILASAFERAKRERRVAFIPYVMAGDPDLATTAAILPALTAIGVDAVELGIPYSDPLADGPTIASAGARALAKGTGITDALTLMWPMCGRCADCCSSRTSIPSINSVSPGSHTTPRGPVPRVRSFPIVRSRNRTSCAAPSTSAAWRCRCSSLPRRHRSARNELPQAATGFVYVVSRLGVTGARKTPDFAPLKAQLLMLREVTRKPLAVGFGLSRPSKVREIVSFTDGVVVGSALIDSYAGHTGKDAARLVTEFVEPLIAAAKPGVSSAVSDA